MFYYFIEIGRTLTAHFPDLDKSVVLPLNEKND